MRARRLLSAGGAALLLVCASYAAIGVSRSPNEASIADVALAVPASTLAPRDTFERRPDSSRERPSVASGPAAARPLALDRTVDHAAFADVETIAGRVVDDAGRGLAGVTVRMITLDPDGRFGHWTTTVAFDEPVVVDVAPSRAVATVTDSTGHWRLPSPPAVADTPATSSIYGDAHLLAFEAPGLTRPVIEWTLDRVVPDVVLVPAADLTGRVVDAQGAAVHGARVWALLHDGPEDGTSWSWICVDGISSATTDAQGRFSIPGVVPGEAYLIVDRAVVPDWIACGVLTAGTTDVGDLRVLRGLSVRGRVLTEAGAPVVGAEVVVDRAYEERSAAPLGRARTDVDGRFEVAGLTHHDVWVTARAAGFGAEPRRHDARGTDDLDLTLEPTRWTTLQIVDARDGTPLDLTSGGVRVEAAAALRPSGTEDDDGRGAPCRVTLDRRRARVELPTSRGSWVDVDVPGHVPAAILVSAERPSHSLALEPEVVLTGRVLTDGFADLRALGPDGVERARTIVRAGERYRMTVAPGVSRLVAVTHDGRRAVRRVDVPPRSDPLQVDLTPTATATLVVTYGVPIRQTFVAEHVATGTRHEHRVGEALDDLVPGLWAITARGFGSVDVMLVPGGRATVSLRRAAKPTLFGTVRLDGRPVAGGYVLVTSHGGPHVGGSSVDGEGRYEFAVDFPEGAHIEWRRGDARWIGPPLPDVPWGGRGRVDIDARSRRLDVLLLDAGGRPIVDGDLFGRTSRGRRLHLGKTDERGRLTMVTLPEGVERVGFGSPGEYDAVAVDIADRPAVVLTTRRAGWIDVSVVDEPCDDEPQSFFWRVRVEATWNRADVRLESSAEVSVPVGAWRVVALPPWVDPTSIPLGRGPVVHVEPGATTEVTVPLTIGTAGTADVR